MIKLKNIDIENNIAKCDFIPEDSVENGYLEIDLNNKKIIFVAYPNGYDWCKIHIEHAKDFLIRIYKSGMSVPNEKTIMWY